MKTAHAAAQPLPRHIAIVMDGNGRWAAARHLPRHAGHRAGIEAVRRTVRAASDLGIGYLTLFGFSSENWKRPRSEVDYLMDLLRFFIRQEISELHANNVRVAIVGDRAGLAEDILKLIDDAQKKTASNSGLTLRIAFNYGGQQEIAAGATKLLADAALGTVDMATAQPNDLSVRLWSAGTPDPELLIRTSGERRLSNFLLWQASHAELVFLDTLWPDFSGAELNAAIDIYRHRRAAAGPVK
jgi:undecaprenyl diphosphate synthase